MATISIADDGKRIQIESMWSEKDLVKQVPGAKWDRELKMWTVPLTWSSCIAMRGVFGDRLTIGADVNKWAKCVRDLRVNPALDLRKLTDYTAIEHTNSHDDVLYGYQKAGREFLVTAEDALLSDEMGLGKTLQVLSAIRKVDQESHGNMSYPALIVCPNSVKRNWEAEINKWLPEATPIVVAGSAAKRREALARVDSSVNPIVIVNIESVRLHSRLKPYGSVRLKRCVECDPKTGEDIKPAQCEMHKKELNEISFRICVLDEAHRVKDPRAKQTRAIWQVFHGETVTYRWALTGTPVANHPGDMWSLMHCVSPEEFPAKSAFLDRYAQMSFNPFGGMDIVGLKPSTKEEFFKIIDPRFRRMLKAVVLPQLPPKTRVVRAVEMSPKQQKAYDEMAASLVTYLDDGTPLISSNNLTAATRLLQLASSYCLVEKNGHDDNPAEWAVELKGPSPKVDELVEIIKENPGKPIAVAAEQRKLLELASKTLDDNEIDHVMITGAVSQDDRADNIAKFQDGKVDIIMFTYAAGGVGLNMQRADTLVRLQRSWSLVMNQQGEDRVHRIGSEAHETITIIDMITAGTIEEIQVERLYEKLGRLEEIVRDRAQLVAAGKPTDHLDRDVAAIESSFLGEA